MHSHTLRQSRALRAIVIPLTAAGTLALSACSGAPQSTSVATVGAAATQAAPTVAAVATQVAPAAATAGAAATQVAPTVSAGATQLAPTVSAAATQVAPAVTSAVATVSQAATAVAAPSPAATAKVNANTATIPELQAAFEAAGISNAARWAREVDEYRPYDPSDTNFNKLRGELAKYNPGPDVVNQIVATLTY